MADSLWKVSPFSLEAAVGFRKRNGVSELTRDSTELVSRHIIGTGREKTERAGSSQGMILEETAAAGESGS
jgi:hypothetical protein